MLPEDEIADEALAANGVIAEDEDETPYPWDCDGAYDDEVEVEDDDEVEVEDDDEDE